MLLGEITLDTTSPDIISDSILPENLLYNAQSTIEISFQVDEGLNQVPSAILDDNDQWAFDCFAIEDLERSFTCTLSLTELTDDLPEGTVAILIELKDPAQNSGFVSIPVVLDLTAPSVAGSSNLASYRVGQTIEYMLQFSEPVVWGEELEILG